MTSAPRVVFFGTPEFAAYILDRLVADGHDIVAAVTTPDKPQGRGLKLQGSAVKIAATAHNIPVITPLKLKDPEFVGSLQSLSADIFCVVAYKILPKEVFTLPILGSFNIHGSLLPKYRGAAPINWAIMRGEKESGITTFLLEEKVDTGNMLLQESTPIEENMTAGELHDKLMEIGARLGSQTITGLASGTLRPMPQSDAEAISAPKIFPADCIVNFDQPAPQVHNFIRGLSPYPAAVAMLPNGVKLKLLRSEVAKGSQGLTPGIFKVQNDGTALHVGTATEPISILELQREGKKAMTVTEFLRGSNTLFSH